MARQLIKALQLAGHEVDLMSRFKCRLKSPGGLAATKAQAEAEVEAIAGEWQRSGVPDLVVVYHVYYKSPDLIGAALAQRFGVPYVTVEASYAGKRDKDEWSQAQAVSSTAIRQAQLNICLTPRDAEGIARLVPRRRVAMLAPFVDLDGFDQVTYREVHGGPVELITVAMMSKGNKINSFNMLAKSLKHLSQANWRLTIVGDGPVRDDVEALFDGMVNVRFAGQMDRSAVVGYLSHSDVFVWPGYREAFGLAYLEAQAMGLPVAAMRSGGVASVVEDGRTGILVDEGDEVALANALDRLIADEGMRRSLGRQARAFVHGERSLVNAARQLDVKLREVAGK